MTSSWRRPGRVLTSIKLSLALTAMTSIGGLRVCAGDGATLQRIEISSLAGEFANACSGASLPAIEALVTPDFEVQPLAGTGLPGSSMESLLRGWRGVDGQIAEVRASVLQVRTMSASSVMSRWSIEVDVKTAVGRLQRTQVEAVAGVQRDSGRWRISSLWVGLPMPQQCRTTSRISTPELRREAQFRVRRILRAFLAAGLGVERPWPQRSGKRFVLSVVTAGGLPLSSEGADSLFSPSDSARSLARVGGHERLSRVSDALLDLPGFDPDPFTSLAGRRNSEHAYQLDADALSVGAVVLADLGFADGAILGYSNGAATWVSREDLGLDENDPIIAGDGAVVASLRALSL